MTILVGILCSDGVVVGADSAATLMAGQQRTIEQTCKKIDIVGEGHVIVASTGSGGMGQRFTAVVDDAWRNKLFQGKPIDVGKSLSTLGIKDFSATTAPKGSYGALVAFPCHHKACLLELDQPDFQPELKTQDLWYVSMGSAQMIADPLLGLARQAFWDDGLPNCRDATFVVTWILSQAIAMNPGGVNGPMRIAVLDSKSGRFAARMVDQADLDGHEANVKGLIDHMRTYRDILRGNQPAQAPAIPKPQVSGSGSRVEAATVDTPIASAAVGAVGEARPSKIIGEA